MKFRNLSWLHHRFEFQNYALTPSKFLCNGYNFIIVPITCTEAHVQSPLHRHYLTPANNHINPAVAAFFYRNLYTLS